MTRTRRPARIWLLATLLAGPAAATPAVSVAAAANLVHVIGALNAGFARAAPEVKLTTATGASGGLLAQIAHGAPFDVFLSADIDYPRQLADRRLGDPASLRVFATGRLVLWTRRTDLDLRDLAALVRSPAVGKIAIAQPRTAPYGRAAEAALARAGVARAAASKLVHGENISQTAQFVETGAADLGLVALSLVLATPPDQRGQWRELPAEAHAPVVLEHAAVLTTRGAANPAARRYLDYLASEPAQRILREHGYIVPRGQRRHAVSRPPLPFPPRPVER